MRAQRFSDLFQQVCVTVVQSASEADLVIVEYALNDGYSGGETNAGTFVFYQGNDCSVSNKLARRGYERLLRKILTLLPATPAVLGVQFQPHFTHNFWQTAEDENLLVSAWRVNLALSVLSKVLMT